MRRLRRRRTATAISPIYQYEARGVLHTGQQATTYSVTLFSTSPEIANTERLRPS